MRTHPEGEQGLDHMRLGHRTIYALDNLLVKWDLTEKFPLRFYAEAPEYVRLYEIDTDKLTQDVRRKPRSFLRRMP